MNKFKKIIIGLVIFVFIILGIAFILPYVVDINDNKALIQQFVEEKTGRKLEITDDLQLKLFPKLVIKTGALKLSNPERFPHKNMFEVANSEIGIQLLPLLFKKIKTTKITLDQPKIKLTKKSNGESNWQLSSVKDNAKDSKQNDFTQLINHFSADGVEIVDADISYIDLSSGNIVYIKNLNLSIGKILPGSRFPLSANFNYSLTLSDEPINAKLSTNVVYNEKNSQFQFFNTTSNIIKNNNNIKFSSENLKLDLPANSLTANQIKTEYAFASKQPYIFKANELRVDLTSLNIKIKNVSADFKLPNNTDAQFNMPAADVDINGKLIVLGGGVLDITNQDDLNIKLNLPETKLAYAKDNLALRDITGEISYKDYKSKLTIPLLAVNNDQQTFNVENIQLANDVIDVDASTFGTLEPFSSSFNFTVKSANVKQFLQSIGQQINTNSNSSFLNLSLAASGSVEQQTLTLNKFNGNLDEIKFDASGSLTNSTNPAIDLDINIGKVNIDDYLFPLTNLNASKSDQSTQENPLTSKKLIINSSIKIERLYSPSSSVDFENLIVQLKQSTQSDSGASLATIISINSQLKLAENPEKFYLKTESWMNFDHLKNQIRFRNFSTKLDRLDQSAQISAPNFSFPLVNADLAIDNIAVKLSDKKTNVSLVIPRLDYDSNNAIAYVNNITGDVKSGIIKGNIIIPNVTVNTQSKQLSIIDTAIDLSAKQAIGRFSIPAVNVDLSNNSVEQANLSFEGENGRADFVIKPDKNFTTGSINTDDFNLRGLLTRMDLINEFKDIQALTQVSIDSKFVLTDNTVRFELVNARVDETQLKGKLQVLFNIKSNYTFNLTIGELDADKYINKQTDSANAAPPIAIPINLPFEKLKEVNAAGIISILKLKASNATFDNLKLGVKALNGVVTINPIKSQFYEGEMTGNLLIHATKQQPTMNFNYQLTDVELANALSSLAISEKLAGKGNFNLKISSKGSNDKQLIANSIGKAELIVNDGELKGINIEKILAKGYAAYKQLKDEPVDASYDPEENTKFSKFSGNWTIDNGIMRGEDLIIQAPAFHISGSGIVSLKDKLIDYKMSVKINKPIDATDEQSSRTFVGRIIPLTIKGNLNNPEYALNVSELIKTQYTTKLQKKLKEKLREKIGNDTDDPENIEDKLIDEATKKIFELFE